MAASTWPPHLEAAQEALGAIVTELAIDPANEDEAQQLLVSMLALSWFHVVHGPTVLKALGINASDPAFLEERRQHVVNLVVQGLRGQLGSGSSPNRPIAQLTVADTEAQPQKKAAS